MEKCIRCGSKKFYLLPRKEDENIKDAAMVAQRCVQCNFFKRWCPKTERHFYQTSREKMTNREWLLTLTDEELARFIIYEAPKIGRQWTASDYGLAEWLKSEKVEEL